MTAELPTRVHLHRRSQLLELAFGDTTYSLNAEYLRVFSPSAEVKGHGPGQEVLQLDKSRVAIVGIEPQGNYAIRIVFSDKHDSGIYSWAYLKELAENHSSNWQTYLAKVAQHQATQDLSIVRIVDPD